MSELFCLTRREKQRSEGYEVCSDDEGRWVFPAETTLIEARYPCTKKVRNLIRVMPA